MEYPKIIDNDRDEITAVYLGREVRGWSYAGEAERRAKMLAAKEFAEGWYQCEKLHEEADDIASEAAWERHQARMMESGGPDDSAYRQQMIDAGRGHLLR